MSKIPLLLLLFASITAHFSNLSAEVVKILILGDTQKIMDSKNGKQDNFVPFMAKLLTDPVTKDADFILQMGDIVESDLDDSDRPQQYLVAQEGWRQLDGKIPYVLNIGNNDSFEEYFEAFKNLPEPFWSSARGRNFAYNFNAGGISWLIISLRYGSSSEENKSVETLIENYPNMKVILIKHEINFNSSMVEQLKKYPNVTFILSGHTQSGKTLLSRGNGNNMGWIRTCHHNKNRDSYFRILLVDTIKGTVNSSFYSPQYEKFWHDPKAPYNDPVRGAPWIWHGFDFGSESSNIPNDAEFVSLEIPFSVAPSQQFEATVTYKNTGTSEWSANSQYKLGVKNLKDNQDYSSGIILSNDVRPTEEHTFVVTCTAPATEGTYSFQSRMLQEGVQWFGEYSENRTVEVTYNVVSDASFENRNKSWQMDSGAIIATGNTRSGDFSLRLTDANNAVVAMSQNIRLTPDTDYHISMWMNSRRVTSGNIIFDIEEIVDEQEGSQLTLNSSGTNGWRQYTGYFNSGALTLATIHIFGSNFEGVAYVDDVVVTPVRNAAPIIKSFAEQTVYENTAYTYSLNATDQDGDVLVYSGLDIPEWLTFNPQLGLLSGIAPPYKRANYYPVTLCVSDGKKEVQQFFYITVVADKPYENWNQLHHVSKIDEDPDGDGFQNLMEFALCGDPNNSNISDELLMQSFGKTSLDFTFRRNQRSINYTIQKSADLKKWDDHLEVNDSHGLVGDICTVSVPFSGNKQFFRLQVSK